METETLDAGEMPIEEAAVLGSSAAAEPAVDVQPESPEQPAAEPVTSDQVRAGEPDFASTVGHQGPMEASEEREVPVVLYRDTERDLEIREGDHVIVSKDGRRDGAIVRGAEEDGLVLERKDEKATRMVVLPSAIVKVVAR